MEDNPGVAQDGNSCTTGTVACSGMTVKNSTMFDSGKMMVNSYYCNNITITHNDMHNFGVETIDLGCWYTSKEGSHGEIAYNHCHDTEAIGYPFGIYMDA